MIAPIRLGSTNRNYDHVKRLRWDGTLLFRGGDARYRNTLAGHDAVSSQANRNITCELENIMEYRIAKIIFVQAIFFSLALSTALASVSTKSYFSGMTTSSPIQRRKVLEGYVTGMIEGIVAANATSKRKFGAFLFCVPNDGVIIFSEVVERMRNDIKKDLRLMEFDLDTNVMGTIEIMYPCEANR